MTKLLVLYYSTYGHLEEMAEAVAEGARAGGAEAVVKRVPETVPEDIAREAHYKLDQAAPEASPEELADYDAIVVGAPTRFGRLASQMAAFWDKTGGLWHDGALVGKVGAAFSASGTQHGGQETTLLSIIGNLMNHGLVIVGLPYSFTGQMGVDEVKGGSPYGATTISDGDGSRRPSAADLAGARFQGEHVARVAAKLCA